MPYNGRAQLAPDRTKHTLIQKMGRGKLKKSAHRYLLNLPISYVLAKRVEYTKDTFASTSSEICALGRPYFGYSVFPGVMLESLMHSPESLFPDLQQLLLALVL